MIDKTWENQNLYFCSDDTQGSPRNVKSVQNLKYTLARMGFPKTSVFPLGPLLCGQFSVLADHQQWSQNWGGRVCQMMFLIKIMSLLRDAAINNEPKIGVGTSAPPGSFEKELRWKWLQWAFEEAVKGGKLLVIGTKSSFESPITRVDCKQLMALFIAHLRC